MPAGFNTFLIDPHTMTINEVYWNGDYNHIYKLIDAECYDCARINHHGDGLFVDDEGLFKEEQRFFVHKDYPLPLAGKAIVLGCDMTDGSTIMPSTTLAELQEKITWVMPIRVNGKVVWIDPEGKPVEINE